MPNLCQPQGVTLNVPLADAKPFYLIEFVEDGQITLPNFIRIDGANHSGNAVLVVNDGLLRTHQDSLIFTLDNTNGAELNIEIHVAKRVITDIATAQQAPEEYFNASYPLPIKAGEKRYLELRLIDERYVLSDRELV